MPATLTFGATPVIPNPLSAAATVPAVWVPWPCRSSQASGSWTGRPVSHEALSAKSMFCTRSGWSLSRPVSMSPTVTSGLPPVTLCASKAWIWRMSHCRAARLSGVAGSFGSSEGCSSAASAPPGPACAIGLLDSATPCTDLSVSRAAAKLGSADLAIATPIWRWFTTRVPPADSTARAAPVLEAFCLYMTRYVVSAPPAAPSVDDATGTPSISRAPTDATDVIALWARRISALLS